MTAIGAQELGCSHDCAWPGCPGEARVRGGYCDRGHTGTPPVLEPAPGELAHLLDGDDPGRAQARTCRAAGCESPRLPAAGGKYAGLCAHHTEIAREANRRRGRWEP
ncbi:hypothetical protein Gocc_2881 [Gaiella occulta]|uniref:Uncharacterized protein n=1 Tax=Gaiella occulta TaxID=1002870 RepID=A0A7M2YSZ0_9ACTN|nr:hypothetical protein [Gaiella occulta]RDI73281.1 hypothetical protein Gocc_2881 [Gaiella occulta]